MRKAMSTRSTTPRRSDVIRLQERLAFRLLLVFVIPLTVIVVLGVYAYRLSARLREVEVLERVSYVDRIYTDTHNVPWARHEYEVLAGRYPRNYRIYVRLGALYHEDGQPARAIDYLSRAIALKPDDWEAHSTLSYIQLTRNQEAAAIEAGEAAIRFNKADAQAYNNLSWIYATTSDERLRNPAKAREYAEKAVSYTRCRKPSYLDTLAEVYRRSGRADEAERILLAPERTSHPLCGSPRIALSGEKTSPAGAKADDGAERPPMTTASARGR